MKERKPEVTHKIMSAIHSKDTKPELSLRTELWRRGLHYQKNKKTLPGKPDIAFVGIRLAVFCDGDFWHGHNWAIRDKYTSLEDELSHYSEYWAGKIRRNIARDREEDERLSEMGWTVIRVWESEIKSDLPGCADRVERVYNELKKASRKKPVPTS